MKFRVATAIATFGILVAAMHVAPAKAVTLQTSNASTGNQAYSAVGLEFQVNAPISVSALGIYDSNQDGIAGLLTAQLMTTSGSILATASFTGTSDPLNNNYRFQTFGPMVVPVGTYFLVGYGFSNTDQNHNSNLGGPPDTFTSDPLVTYITSVWTPGGGDVPGTLPSSSFGLGSPDFFGGANLEFAAATPLPATWIMMLTGLAGFGFVVYRRQKKGIVLAAA